MTDHTKLVEALRCCTSSSPDDCDICAYQPFCQRNGTGRERIMIDATAAIEALQKRIVSALTALHLANEKMGYYGIQPYTEADGEDMISDWVKTLVHEELKQQLPKRGKWITHPEVKNIYGGVYIECPFCGEKYVVQNVSDEKFCRNCGADLRAKMEVQDGKRCD